MWWKLTLFGSGILLFVALLFYLLTVQETLREESRAAQSGPANVLRLSGAFFQQHEQGRLAWEIWAERALVLEGRREARLTDVHFRLFPHAPKGTPALTISGSSGGAELIQDGELVILTKDVHLREGEDIELRGERLVYHHGDGLLTSSDPVWVRSGDIQHQGHDMRYRITEQRLTLANPSIYQ